MIDDSQNRTTSDDDEKKKKMLKFYANIASIKFPCIILRVVLF